MDKQQSDQFWNRIDLPDLKLEQKPSDLKVKGADSVSSLTYNSTIWHGEPIRIFAFASFQPKPADCPTVIMIHGGGGTADSLFKSRTSLYGPAGFNIISLDLPGRGDQRAGSRSTGPDMMYANLFWRGDDLHDAWLFHAVWSVRRATDAAAQLGCDPKQILLDGWSWGGVVAPLACALDPRVKATAAVYGSGHLYRGAIGRDISHLPNQQAQRWRDAFDPAEQHYSEDKQLYLISGSNDGFFALPDNARTAQTLGAIAHLALSPNKDHALDKDYQASLDRWVIDVMSNKPMGWPTVGEAARNGDQVAVAAENASTVDWVVTDDIQAKSIEDPIDWPKLHWQVFPKPVADGRSSIDAALLRDHLWYLSAREKTGLIASTGLHVSVPE